jgi:hypothetical protein
LHESGLATLIGIIIAFIRKAVDYDSATFIRALDYEE